MMWRFGTGEQENQMQKLTLYFFSTDPFQDYNSSKPKLNVWHSRLFTSTNTTVAVSENRGMDINRTFCPLESGNE